MAIRGDDFAGKRVSRLAQARGQRFLDLGNRRVDTTVARQYFGTGLCVCCQVVRLVIGKGRHTIDQLSNAEKLHVGHFCIDRGSDDHCINQGGVRVETAHNDIFSLLPPQVMPHCFDVKLFRLRQEVPGCRHRLCEADPLDVDPVGKGTCQARRHHRIEHDEHA